MGKDVLFGYAETSRSAIGQLLSIGFIAGAAKLGTAILKRTAQPQLLDAQVAGASHVSCFLPELRLCTSFLFPVEIFSLLKYGFLCLHSLRAFKLFFFSFYFS